MLIWTAFQWGLAGGCGLAAAIFLLIVATRLLNWATGKCDQALASLEALRERNELTKKTNAYLSQLADAAESISAHQTLAP